MGHAVLAIGTVVLAVHIGRSYCRSIAKLHEEVSGFRVDRLKSYCCSVDHHDPTSGEAMPCDRKIILQCVRTWFDTVQAFERRVQTEVLQILIYQLSNEALANSWGVLGWFDPFCTYSQKRLSPPPAGVPKCVLLRIGVPLTCPPTYDFNIGAPKKGVPRFSKTPE